ncbi:MAG: trypsin-like peptidase domain-containing protein [Candidatus Latescibacterota bacterium]
MAAWGGPALPEQGEPGAARRHLEGLSLAFRAAYREVRPVVVLITTTRQWQALQRMLPPFHPPVPQDTPGPEGPHGLGSGIIVSTDGYILSNYHVVQGADSILVTLHDRRVFAARVVGVDSLIDVALLKIEAAALPVARLGDSDELEIGDWVLAIGYPLGMGTTLTHGIVSALGRQPGVITDDYGIESFVQTNAVINPGNSGGPLLNLGGEVVGINSAISTRTGYFMRYGLAVPVNLAREAMRDILAHGRVVRGYLGVEMAPVDQDMVGRLHLTMDHPAGVHIKVYPGSPAERGGLQTGDIILAVRGHEVDSPNQIQTLVYSLDPGDRVALTFLRDGESRQAEVVLGEREEDRLLAHGQERVGQLGLTVAALDEQQAATLGFGADVAAELGFSRGEQAVVVTAVDEGSQAAQRRIEVNDVITDVDQTRVTSLAQFVGLVSRLQAGESALFWLWRPQAGVDVRVLEIPR